MLAGRKAFEAQSQASVIAAIIHVDPPDVSTLQSTTPIMLDRVVKTCLAKDPDKRWQTAHDLSLQLKWISEGSSFAERPVADMSTRRRSGLVPWIVTIMAVSVAALLAVPALRYFRLPTDSLAPRFEIQTSAMPNPYQISISPDGTTLAYVAARSDGVVSLFVRPIDSVTAQPLPGTEGALLPFWSPDSHYIGYGDPQRRKLKKVSVRGGPPQDVCDVPYSGNAVPTGTWNSSDVIVFSNGDANQPLYRVAASGGTPAQITTPDKALQEIGHSWPWFLPDGRHYLYMVRSSNPENSGIYVGSLDSVSRTRLVSAASMPAFAPPGFLLFHREGTLFAQRFDDRSLGLSGEPILIAENVVSNPTNGRASFAVSSNGTLIYRSGRTDLPLTWVDRTGKTQNVAAEPGNYANPALSPDEKRVAVTRLAGSDGDILIMDLVHGATTPFTSSLSLNTMALWSPDGKIVTFASDRGGTSNLYRKQFEGSADEELLLKTDHSKVPEDWSSDARYLLYGDRTPTRSSDIWVLPMDGEHKPFVFLQRRSSDPVARFSPDTHWVLYQSNESGREEVYVRSFPTPGERFQISNGGGVMPKWRSDGKEIFYINGNGLMAVDVMRAERNKTFTAGPPRLLFQATFSTTPYPYDVSRDGQRFIINGIPNSTGVASIPITVVLNWPALANKSK
jgi:Tol biopolymer transport system component